MEVGMANAAEEDFDLHVAGSGIAARNGGGGQWRGLAGGRIGFGLVDGSHGVLSFESYRELRLLRCPRLKSNALIEYEEQSFAIAERRYTAQNKIGYDDPL
jgi:hypothetical protein